MQARRHLDNFDWVLFLSVLSVCAVGLGVIYSATAGTPIAGAFHRQIVWLGIGLVFMAAAILIDYHTLAEFSYVFYGLALTLLGLTLAVGRVVNASKSWLGTPGFQFQPSELAKSATILMVAAYLGRERVRGLGLVNFSAICAIVGAPVLLIMMQPDLGTAVTYVPLLLGATFLGGIRVRTLIILAVVATLALPMVWGHLKPYQKERVKTFVEPTRDPKGAGYQLIQSFIAVGSGGILGKGFLAGTQGQLQFLPEQHTDFVFAVLAEERGFVGSLLVLGLYFLIMYRCVATARASRDRLGIHLTMGVVCVLGAQALLNIGVVVGLLPTTGVPLSLMSYGGSSLVNTLLCIGLVLNVWMHRLVN
ncbi:MAG TPA: rod shape-determining protein RodA [Candidatus Polarisedimenticolia bacterium]|nr:rod shape-determining protein RodA [Candidatus Polarisedimenticolia bacterium]